MKRTLKPVAWMKIYDRNGQYRASFVDCTEAASFVAILGDGANVRNGHGQKNVIWFEGREEFSASESYDGFLTCITSKGFARQSVLKQACFCPATWII